MIVKALAFIAITLALIPGIDKAREMTGKYQRMQATVAMLGDTDVLRSNARFDACMREISSQKKGIAGKSAALPGGMPEIGNATCRQ